MLKAQKGRNSRTPAVTGMKKGEMEIGKHLYTVPEAHPGSQMMKPETPQRNAHDLIDTIRVMNQLPSWIFRAPWFTRSEIPPQSLSQKQTATMLKYPTSRFTDPDLCRQQRKIYCSKVHGGSH